MSWLYDLLIVAGLGAVVYGASLWSVPAAWVLGGGFAVAFGMLSYLRTPRSSGEPR